MLTHASAAAHCAASGQLTTRLGTVLLRKTLLSKVGLIALALLSTPAAQASEVPEVPRIEVRGEAVVRVPAELIEFNISVVSEDAQADRALAQNNAKAAAVRKALEGAGIPGADIQTGQFQLQPQWSIPPPSPGPGWRPAIIGFVVENQVRVRTSKLQRSGAALSAASTAGANRIGELRFALTDDNQTRSEAIRQATRNALRDADTIADAAGLKRGSILSVVLEPSPTTPYPMQQEMRTMAMADAGSAVPVDVGTIEVHAAVQLRVATGD